MGIDISKSCALVGRITELEGQIIVMQTRDEDAALSRVNEISSLRNHLNTIHEEEVNQLMRQIQDLSISKQSLESEVQFPLPVVIHLSAL